MACPHCHETKFIFTRVTNKTESRPERWFHRCKKCGTEWEGESSTSTPSPAPSPTKQSSPIRPSHADPPFWVDPTKTKGDGTAH
jgi:hypothetical protein